MKNQKDQEKIPYNDIKQGGAEKRAKALTNKIKQWKEDGTITPMLKR
jgi:hypothetical protein